MQATLMARIEKEALSWWRMGSMCSMFGAVSSVGGKYVGIPWYPKKPEGSWKICEDSPDSITRPKTADRFKTP